MQTLPTITTAHLDEVKPGSFIGFRFRNETHYGIAINDPATGGVYGVIDLRHPDFGAPGVITANSIRIYPVAVFEDATVILNASAESLVCGVDWGPPTGSICTLGEGQTILAAAVTQSDDIRLFRLGDGSRFTERLNEKVWFTSWRVVTSLPDRSFLTLWTQYSAPGADHQIGSRRMRKVNRRLGTFSPRRRLHVKP